MNNFGDEKLLKQASDLCYELEKLPPGDHQTKLISHASAVAFALQQLQKNGDHFWPRPAPLTNKQLDAIRDDQRDQLVSNDVLRAVDRAHGMV